MLIVILGAGMLSAVLMNGTLAIIGTPEVLLISRKHGMSPKLLIALNEGNENPFLLFLRHLFLPSVVNLFLTFLVLRWSLCFRLRRSRPLSRVLCRNSG